MPLKQPYFAVLAGLLAKRDAHLVSDITTSIEGHMKKAFESGETRHIRLLLFFLSALAEVYVAASLCIRPASKSFPGPRVFCR